MKTVGKVLMIVGCLTCFPVIAFAGDGNVDTTSTGNTTITLNVPEYVIVGGIGNLALGGWDGQNAMSGNDNIYVSGNDDTAPTYSVTLTGDGTTNAFTVSRTAGTAHEITYLPCFNDVTGTVGCDNTFDTGDAISGFTGANTSIDSTTENANISVSILESDLDGAPAGNYSGVLTILITPDA